MADGYKNFSYGTVATAPSPASTGLTLVLAAGQGIDFPTAPFNVTVWPAGVQPRSFNAERARVVTVATDTLTFEDAGGGARAAQEGSVARSIVVGDQIAFTWGKKEIDDIYTAIAGAGGGFTVGSSYLVCTTLDALANASNALPNIDFTQDTLVGSDLSVTPGPGAVVNVLTSGWYDIAVGISVYADTAELLSLTGPTVYVNASPLIFGQNYIFPPVGVDGLTNFLHLPPIHVSSGGAGIYPIVSATTTAGTWSSFGSVGYFRIARLS